MPSDTNPIATVGASPTSTLDVLTTSIDDGPTSAEPIETTNTEATQAAEAVLNDVPRKSHVSKLRTIQPPRAPFVFTVSDQGEAGTASNRHKSTRTAITSSSGPSGTQEDAITSVPSTQNEVHAVRHVPVTMENRNHNPAEFGAQGAAVDHAVAEHMAESTQHTGYVRPSFTSSFANVPDIQRRHMCDRQSVKRPRLQGSVLDDTRLGGMNEWATTAVDGMALTRYVLTPDVFNRRDVQRIRMLYDKDPMSARDVWSRKKLQREWFEIPSTLQCDRTFARDPLECYYLESLDEFLRCGNLDEGPQVPPLLQDPLFPRWWTQFRYRNEWLREIWYQHKYSSFVPHDDLEVQHWDGNTLRAEYPFVPSIYTELNIPPALPVPTPPVVWYHHWEIMQGSVLSPRVLYLKKMVHEESIYLAIASWYNEMVHGNRMFIHTPAAIDRFQNVAGCRSIVPGAPTSHIIELMRAARTVPSDLWNEMRFSDETLPVSYFVDSIHGHVNPQVQDIGGRVIYISTRSRRIHDDLRQTRRMEERNTSVLRLQLYQNEINQVPGLIDIAREQQWMLQRGLSVSNVLRNLLQKISYLKSDVLVLRSQVQVPSSENVPQPEDDGPMF